MLTRDWKCLQRVVVSAVMLAVFQGAGSVWAADTSDSRELYIPISRSQIVSVAQPVATVTIDNQAVAGAQIVGDKRIKFVGKRTGSTSVKAMDKSGKLIRSFDVVVGSDIPAIRKALHSFLPRERIGVELVNTNIALTGEVTDASVAEKAMKIVNEFVAANPSAPVLNFMKVISGQQVMLRVRVGEVQRSALKSLGVNLSGSKVNNFTIGTAFGDIIPQTGATNAIGALGSIGGATATGELHKGTLSLSATLEALEQNGLFKLLAEPDLVAMSGEKAEFLAGGEFPIPVPQISGGSTTTTMEFKKFGVAVQFIPFVLSENRIRVSVEPEVSEIDRTQSTTTNGVTVPGLSTRRAKTTVELAPGESFMIAGLLSDRLNSNINQIPGAADIPILGALLRSTEYQRNETELVIAVTPYIVDPLKSSEVRLPTDDFRPASVLEQFFFGALGSTSGTSRSSQPSLEGPIGFMPD